MYMIMFVLDDVNHLDGVLDAWREVGVSGATIIESTGIHRRQVQTLGARYLFAVPRPESIEQGNYTLFVAVPNLETVQLCAKAAEKIVGDLDAPHSGVLFSWELAFVRGVPEELLDAEGKK